MIQMMFTFIAGEIFIYKVDLWLWWDIFETRQNWLFFCVKFLLLTQNKLVYDIFSINFDRISFSSKIKTKIYKKSIYPKQKKMNI